MRCDAWSICLGADPLGCIGEGTAINLKSLLLFRQIVLTGSLSDAARQTNLSPSSASRQIALLEEEVGLTLFSRERRRLMLTTDGDIFYRRIAPTISGLVDIEKISSEIRSQSGTALSIVTAAPTAGTLASPAIALLAAKVPRLEVSLHVETRFDIESRVAARGYSLGLISLPVENAILDLDVEPFLQARIEVMLRRDHPLAEKGTLSVEDIAGQPFVSLRPQQRWRDRVDEILGGAGHKPYIPYITSSTVVVTQMVRDGLGLALTDRATVHLPHSDALVLRPLEPEYWVTYAGLHPAGPRAPLSAAFLDGVSAVVESWRAEDPGAAANLRLI